MRESKKYTIKYIPQPDFYSCDQACLAMAAGINIEEAMEVMGDKKVLARQLCTKLLKSTKSATRAGEGSLVLMSCHRFVF